MKTFPLLGLFCLALQTAYAGTDVSQSLDIPEPDPFAEGAHEVNAIAGYLVSPLFARSSRPALRYVQSELSLGSMLSAPAPLWGRNWLRGNWEALGNVFAMGVTTEPSGFLSGGRLLLRYNFVQPQARWVPFLQIGAGVLGDNLYQHNNQRLIGSGVEFSLVADAGIRYFFTPKWAAVFTADFEHISNANTASRNVGVNAGGGMLGVGYFF